MPDTIRDGKGKGYLAAVNADNQLITRSTAVEQRLHSSIDGHYFEATTGQIDVTTANETPMIYIKNQSTDSDEVIVIDRVFIDTWDSTGGSGGGTIMYYRNPTISGGTDIIPVDSNYGSGNVMVGTFKKSMTTLTDGNTWWWGNVGEDAGMVVEEGRIVIPPGYSMGISYTAPASNTSQYVAINVAMYVLNTELVR